MWHPFALLLAVLAAATASPNGEYTIMMSNTIRPNTPLEISILILNIDEAVILTANLQHYTWHDGATTNLTSDTKLYTATSNVIRDTWMFDIPSLQSDNRYRGQYKLTMTGSGGIVFNNITDLNVQHKTRSMFIQTDKGMYKPGQEVKFRVFEVNPDLEPIYDTITISLKDTNDNLLWQRKDIARSQADNMGVVKGSYQLSDQPVLGSWRIVVKTENPEEEFQQNFEVAEFVLPKFEVQMKFDSNHHLSSGQTIKGKVCGKYTYGQPVKGTVTVGVGITERWGGYVYYDDPYSGNYKTCGYETGQQHCYWSRGNGQICEPRPICPFIKVDLELDKGCAEIEIGQKELYWLSPAINQIMRDNDLNVNSPWADIDDEVRQYQTSQEIRQFFLNKVLNVKANVTEEATGKIIPGDTKVNFIDQELFLQFSSQMEQNFKPGLPYQMILEVKGPDQSPATPEMLKDNMGQPLTMSITVKKVLYYYWPDWRAYDDGQEGLSEPLDSWPYGGYRGTRDEELLTMQVPVPSDGVIIRSFPVPEEPNYERLQFEARMLDRYGKEAQATNRVNVHKTRTNNQMSLRKTIVPGGKDQVGTTMEFFINATASFNKLYYVILGKGQVRRQDVLTFNPPINTYNLEIFLDSTFARQISPTGRILILACVQDEEEQEEMLAASLDFTVDGAMANHVNLRFAPNETRPGNDVNIYIDTQPESYVGLLAMDQSMILLAGDANDVTEDEVVQELGQYDSAGGGPIFYGRRRKRSSFWCPWCYPWSRGGSDPSQVIKNAGAVVFSNCPIYSDTPQYPTYGIYGRPAPGGPRGFGGAAGFPESAGIPGPAGPPMNEAGRAGPVGQSGPTKTLATVQRVRQTFPESWIWTDTRARADGTQELTVQAPDTITSWVLSAFSLNQMHGLGVAETTKLRVFKPFFVSMDLPYHMIQGEVGKMQITVFNYKTDEQEVRVTLKSSDEYIIMDSLEQNEVVQQDQIYNLNIDGDDSETIVVFIRPEVITTALYIEVHAQSPEAADALRRKIVVKPPGQPEEKTDSVLVIINDEQTTFTHQLRVADLLPEEDSERALVPGSEFIFVTAQGDLMGSTLDNLGSLIKMPYGCGEQNMINFVPNIAVLRYLKAVNKASPELEQKAINYMMSGYSRELTYQHDEGGFSAFGNSDSHASTWLSAFVAKSFAEASEFITIDNARIERTVSYLLTTFDPSGFFVEHGQVHHNELKGGAGRGDALTAYVVIALETVVDHIENEDLRERTRSAITSALDYLTTRLDDGEYTEEKDSSYTLAIVTKALVCSDSVAQSTKNMAIEKLAEKAINDGGMTHWADADNENANRGRRYWRNPSTDIERTAYAAMAYMCKDGNSNVGDVIPILKWLITQQGPYGGYGSTQDTVLTIGFLADFSVEYTSNDNMNIDISLRTNNAEYRFGTLTTENAPVLQKIQLDKTAEYVNVLATGTTGGVAIVQLVVKYYTMVEEADPAVTVDVVTNVIPNSNSFEITACGKWEKEDDSSMGVVTLTLPSGYEADPSDLVNTNREAGLKRIDKTENEINLYIDKFIAGRELCFGPILAEQVNQVANLQEARVYMYDYYNTGLNGYRMYLPAQLAGVGLPGNPDGGNNGNGGNNGSGGPETGAVLNGSPRLACSVVIATILGLVSLFLKV